MDKLRLVIVDDEKVIRDTLANLIHWEDYGVEVVAVCKNGLEAYDAVVDEYPDIVLTDIRMPGLSGLELIEKLNQNYDNVSFIVLSGYDDFSYAQKSLELGVKSYLLKPCNEQEVIKAIEAIRKTREKEGNTLYNKKLSKKLLFSFLVEATTSSEPLERLITEYNKLIDFSNSYYRIYYIYYLKEGEEESFLKILLNLNPNIIEEDAYILYTKHTMILMIGDKVGCKLPKIASDSLIEMKSLKRECLAQLIKPLILNLRRFDVIYIYDGNKKIPFYNYSCCQLQIKQLYNKFIQAEISRMEFKEQFLEEINYIESKDFLYGFLTDSFIENYQVPENSALFSDRFMKALQKTQNVNDIKKLIEDNFDEVFLSEYEISRYKPFIKRLIQYTNTHIADSNLSLKWISENVLFMNVDYVSKQFLKQTGEKYSSYLNKLRIQKAETLLCENESYKINDIVELIGCGNNPHYFSYLFKKYKGITPTEYLEQSRKKRQKNFLDNLNG